MAGLVEITKYELLVGIFQEKKLHFIMMKGSLILSVPALHILEKLIVFALRIYVFITGLVLQRYANSASIVYIV